MDATFDPSRRKHHRPRGAVTAALAALLAHGCALEPDAAADPGGAHEVALMLGVLNTQDIQDAESSLTRSHVDPWAFALEGGYSARILRLPQGQLRLGIDYAYALGDLDGQSVTVAPLTTEHGGAFELHRLTPRLSWERTFGRGPDGYTSLCASVGAGWYGLRLSADQVRETWIVWGSDITSRTLLSDDCFGGFVALSLRRHLPKIRTWIGVEAQLHFVDFTLNDEFTEPGASLDGPLPALLIGAGYRF